MHNKIKVITVICAILIVVHILNVVTQGSLFVLGIRPGDLHSLPNILTAPFIHGTWSHLVNNLFGLIIFSLLCLLRGVKFYMVSSLIIIVLTGLLVWVFARKAVHIGASGWVFGLWSLSIAIAFFQRSFVNIAIAVFVLFFYGGMIYGVLPQDRYVSFESHLFGAIAGIVCAYFMTKNRIR